MVARLGHLSGHAGIIIIADGVAEEVGLPVQEVVVPGRWRLKDEIDEPDEQAVDVLSISPFRETKV